MEGLINKWEEKKERMKEPAWRHIVAIYIDCLDSWIDIGKIIN